MKGQARTISNSSTGMQLFLIRRFFGEDVRRSLLGRVELATGPIEVTSLCLVFIVTVIKDNGFFIVTFFKSKAQIKILKNN